MPGRRKGRLIATPAGRGTLRRARELEAMGFLYIAIQQPLELNWQSAIKLLP
ncbi:hypothetical protein [Streptomyces sp. NBC_01285]|uniref:hypothetical protein n=1 Tax=Streptomyces sp. NBC_01285 TaxID=2903813 RepID=UPI0022553D92|nr:hypothetical protein [Streptomyces sp. NBC_01285]